MTLPPRPDLIQLLLAATQRQNRRLEIIQYLLGFILAVLLLPIVYVFLTILARS